MRRMYSEPCPWTPQLEFTTTPHAAEEHAAYSAAKSGQRSVGEREKALDRRTISVQLRRKCRGDGLAATWDLEPETLNWSLHSPRKAPAWGLGADA